MFSKDEFSEQDDDNEDEDGKGGDGDGNSRTDVTGYSLESSGGVVFHAPKRPSKGENAIPPTLQVNKASKPTNNAALPSPKPAQPAPQITATEEPLIPIQPLDALPSKPAATPTTTTTDNDAQTPPYLGITTPNDVALRKVRKLIK